MLPTSLHRQAVKDEPLGSPACWREASFTFWRRHTLKCEPETPFRVLPSGERSSKNNLSSLLDSIPFFLTEVVQQLAGREWVLRETAKRFPEPRGGVVEAENTPPSKQKRPPLLCALGRISDRPSPKTWHSAMSASWRITEEVSSFRFGLLRLPKPVILTD